MNDVAAFEAMVPEFLAKLEILVNVNSPSGDLPGLTAMADRLEGMLSEIGSAVRTSRQVTDLGPVLKAEIGPGAASEGRRVLMVGHMDTVFPPDEAAKNPFRIEGTRLFGPGVADMKGGVLLGLLALREAVHRDARGAVTFLLTPDEEIGSPASTPIIEEEARRHDASLVLEPGRADGSVVTARKGAGTFLIRAQGRAAHAGVAPEEGRSAVLELCEQALELRRYAQSHPELTVNVGTFRGGTATNVVPEAAEMNVDVRVDDRAALEASSAFFHALTARTEGCRVAVEGGFHFPPMVANAPVRRLYELARSSALDLGFPLTAVKTGGGSDANRIAALGGSVLDALGPVGGRAHSPDEYVEIPWVARRGALLLRLLLSLGGGPAGLPGGSPQPK